MFIYLCECNTVTAYNEASYMDGTLCPVCNEDTTEIGVQITLDDLDYDDKVYIAGNTCQITANQLAMRLAGIAL